MLKNKKLKIVVAGGGTAGHIIPALVVVKEFAKINPEAEFLYIAEKTGMAKKLVSDFKKINKIKMQFKGISAGKLHRYFRLDLLIMPFRVLAGIWQSFKILRKFKPSAIFVKGGYVGVPVAVAGVFLRVPIILHETDSSFGLANKIISPFAKKVAMSFPKKLGDKFVYTGNPVREKFFKLRSKPTSKSFTILIVGGSTGAHKINLLISEIIPELTGQYKIVHITGSKDYNWLSPLANSNYKPLDFTNDIAKLMSKSDLVISRSGGFIFEVAAMAKPAIFIPLSTKGSRGEQIDNAKIFKKAGAGVVLKEDNLTSKKLLHSINELMGNFGKRKSLSDNIEKFAHIDAAEKVVELIMEEAK